MDERVNELMPLAAKIAGGVANLPGLPHAKIELAAQDALVRAAMGFSGLDTLGLLKSQRPLPRRR
ncbi:MAG: hypothetical protein K9N23_16855 [Akkermansiaceae bacterium]|nr:hypothetical protein [Akkermansiaceae bacterium]MCF7733362.1 hypothetical protein [Akkermansiaceae bacterium]